MSTGNIDFTTLKKWIPDYANRSNTNLIPNKETTVTIQDTGFICFSIIRYSNGNHSAVSINGKQMMESPAASSGYGTCTGVLPVTSGDIVTLEYNTDTPHYMYFIPGKWV